MVERELYDSDVELYSLKFTPLEELREALVGGFSKNFSKFEVDIVDCPNLTENPFNLAGQYLGGRSLVVQVGDPGYLLPRTVTNKIYDFEKVAKTLGLDSTLILGAGGGCWQPKKLMSEFFMNVSITGKDCTRIYNRSRYVLSKDKTIDGIAVEKADVNETEFFAVGNLFVCDAQPGKVIKITCARRIGSQDAIVCINSSLKAAFDYPIAVGVVSLMVSGKATHHICPEFPNGLYSTNQLNEWLLLPDVEAPFVSIGTLLTRNPPGWNLINQHIHSYGEKKGGHYRKDVTPDDVEYVIYISPAQTLCSIDKPKNSVDIFNYDVKQ